MEFLYPERLMYFIPLVILILFLVKKHFVKILDPKTLRRRIHKLLLIISRITIIGCLVVALAVPYFDLETKLPGDRSLTILMDNSASMQLFDKEFIDSLKKEISKKIPVKVVSIASEKRSNIGDGILANLGKNRNMLLITDGNNNEGSALGDISLFAADLNATINAIELEPAVNELAVTIEGPTTVLSGAETEFRIAVSSIREGTAYRLIVKIDGVGILDEIKTVEETTIKQAFSQGAHRIEAIIEASDYFPDNNVYYKAVHAIPKPDVLFVSKKESPLYYILEQLYKTTKVSSIPQSLGEYYAVVLNDIHGDLLDRKDVEKLTDFVIDGNGLVVIGGQTSYDYGSYKFSQLASLLPVKIGAGEKEPKPDLNSVVLVDISEADPCWGDFTVMKTRAHNLIDEFRLNDNIGVVAYGEQYHVLSAMGKMANKDVPELKEKIRKLKEEDCGRGVLICSNIANGVGGAAKLLEGTMGEKQIILFSDGYYGLDTPHIEKIAKYAADNNIKMHTVWAADFTGKGHCPFGVPNKELYMSRGAAGWSLKEFAITTGGEFLEPSLAESISIAIDRVSKDEVETIAGERSLVLLNNYHFITKGIEVTGRITGLNQVLPKSGGRRLITTSLGEPILVTVRFGLVRVVSFATDDGTSWAGQLLNKQNSKLISRMMNWAIGEPERKQEYFIRIDDTRIDKKTDVIVKSEKVLTSEQLTFYKTGEDLYSAEVMPQNIGFNDVLGTFYAANYNMEYEKLGFNDELARTVYATDGKIFKPDEAKKIVEHIIKTSERIDVQKKRMSWPFIIAALIIFLADIIVRRVSQNIKNV